MVAEGGASCPTSVSAWYGAAVMLLSPTKPMTECSCPGISYAAIGPCWAVRSSGSWACTSAFTTEGGANALAMVWATRAVAKRFPSGMCRLESTSFSIRARSGQLPNLRALSFSCRRTVTLACRGSWRILVNSLSTTSAFPSRTWKKAPGVGMARRQLVIRIRLFHAVPYNPIWATSSSKNTRFHVDTYAREMSFPGGGAASSSSWSSRILSCRCRR
mmetsp:Transcript_36461/g.65205  ORF Transcript_36461/g.65205 Transcript_36461/m.65205 type:complete len:217 (+) Transcript_36461:2019-2669(+)